ncbi:MAG TPA: pyrroloquinoline quinone-dependent dehydrogenase [Blastocatellia bacterium]|nr:pyrroloquinoline quinone-dependent dehydrogenase [Blastocatellia bacterium]
MKLRPILVIALLPVICVMHQTDGQAQRKNPGATSGPPASDWPAYGRDPGGSRFSPLKQINRANVKNLKVAWVYRTGDLSDGQNARSSSAFQCTPLLVDGTLYLATPFNRVVALDPLTGKERWVFDPKIELKRPYDNQLNSRGVSTWLDPQRKDGEPCRRRILMGTNDSRLIALDAATGKRCEDFGAGGDVDLAGGVSVSTRNPGEYAVTSPPAIINDLVVVGAAIGDNNRVTAPSGVVRAYDVRTGKLRWAWDPIPPNFKKTDTSDAGYQLGTANVWSIISVDQARDLIFLPTGNTSPDYYGGERKGSDFYSSSVVALRGSTGRVVWHFQTVHHDVWDYDIPAQPALITLMRNGREIPAVAVATKVGHLFVLHRETGKPLFPVVERPVPQNGVEGEQLSPTQPFPVKPRALAPQSLKPDDAFGLTEADKKACRDQIASLRNDGVFTPPSLQGTSVYPGDVGGMNWSGMSFDPQHALLITNTNRLARAVTLIPRKDFLPEQAAKLRGNPLAELARQEGTPYLMKREIMIRVPLLVPCTPPPWGTLVAVDLNSGEVRWEVPLGVMPELADRPDAAKWGSLNLGGSIVTAGGLVFIGAARDNYLRAFDVETGVEVWKGELPAGGQATPMTYQAGGKQFVVIAAGGHGRLPSKRGDHVVAFALP